MVGLDLIPYPSAVVIPHLVVIRRASEEVTPKEAKSNFGYLRINVFKTTDRTGTLLRVPIGEPVGLSLITIKFSSGSDPSYLGSMAVRRMSWADIDIS